MTGSVGVADGEPADLARGLEVALHDRRRDEQQLGDVVEAAARVVGRQQQLVVELGRQVLDASRSRIVLRYSVRVSRCSCGSAPGIRRRRGAAVERVLEVRRDALISRGARPLVLGRRHRPGTQLAHDALEQLGMCADVLESGRLEHDATRLRESGRGSRCSIRRRRRSSAHERRAPIRFDLDRRLQPKAAIVDDAERLCELRQRKQASAPPNPKRHCIFRSTPIAGIPDVASQGSLKINRGSCGRGFATGGRRRARGRAGAHHGGPQPKRVARQRRARRDRRRRRRGRGRRRPRCSPQPSSTTSRSRSLLLAAGARVDAANRNNITPLAVAALNGNAALVEQLARARRARRRAVGRRANRADAAAQNGRPEAVAVLLERGANVNAIEPFRGQTALMWAAGGRQRRRGARCCSSTVRAPRTRRRRASRRCCSPSATRTSMRCAC